MRTGLLDQGTRRGRGEGGRFTGSSLGREFIIGDRVTALWKKVLKACYKLNRVLISTVLIASVSKH